MLHQLEFWACWEIFGSLIKKVKIQLEFLIISLNFERMCSKHRCLKNLVKISHNLESKSTKIYHQKKSCLSFFWFIYLPSWQLQSNLIIWNFFLNGYKVCTSIITMTDLDKLRNMSNIPAFVFLRGRNLSMHFSLWFIIFNIFWWAAFFFLPPESQLSSKRPLFTKEVFSLLPWQTVWRAGRTSSRSSWGILAWVDSRASSQHITPHHISHFTYHITTAQHITPHQSFSAPKQWPVRCLPELAPSPAVSLQEPPRWLEWCTLLRGGQPLFPRFV